VTKRFTPPTEAEVAAYVAEKGYHFSPTDFVEYYASVEWKVGKALKPMAIWRSACWTFESNWRGRHPNWNAAPKPASKARTDWENAPEPLREIRFRWARGERITDEEFGQIMNWMDGKEA